MTPQILESSLTFAACAALAAYVATRGQRNATHWLLLTLQASMMCWTGGNVLARVVGPELSEFGVFLAFLGVFAVCPAWLLLASAMTRLGPFVKRVAGAVAAC